MSTARARGYDQDYIYGSAAYDLNRMGDFEEFPLESPLPGVAQPRRQTREEAQAGAKAAVRPASVQSISPFSILGFITVGVLVVFMLLSYVRLITISEESVALEQQLSELAVERTRLLIDYESAFNLTEIEEYATTRLGMQKPRADQIFYVDGSSPDKAQVLASRNGSNPLLGLFDDLFDSLGEYFS